MVRKEKNHSSWTGAASTLIYTTTSWVSRIRAITDTDTGDEKRTGEVPTLDSGIGESQGFKIFIKYTALNVTAKIHLHFPNCPLNCQNHPVTAISGVTSWFYLVFINSQKYKLFPTTKLSIVMIAASSE